MDLPNVINLIACHEDYHFVHILSEIADAAHRKRIRQLDVDEPTWRQTEDCLPCTTNDVHEEFKTTCPFTQDPTETAEPESLRAPPSALVWRQRSHHARLKCLCACLARPLPVARPPIDNKFRGWCDVI